MLMRAWRWYGFNDARLDEVPVPAVQPGWVLLKTSVVQLSLTEALLARGLRSINYEFLRTRFAEGQPMQLFGHEFCATVVEVGAGVERLEVGDRVCASNMVVCHKCGNCLDGRPDLCASRSTVGFHLPGCLAEYAVLPADVLTRVLPAVSDHEAAGVQPLSESIEAVASAELELGDTCVVIGAGSMGLGCIQGARASGAGKIIALDVRAEALALAKQLGADELVDSRTVDPVDAVLDLTNGAGPDVVFEAAGGGAVGFAAIHQATDMVRAKGKIVQVAHLGTKGELNYDRCRVKSIRLIFPGIGSRRLMEHTMRMLAAGQLSVKPMLTHVVKGLDKVPEAIEITVNKAKYGAINPAQIEL
ncbi:MAG: Zn-dependent alcohol dehydrogenase [Chloroflexota bacterium]|nr:MAG: Zn-dependent alcohol dehydrogenase [Chloroflexota bacterium]